MIVLDTDHLTLLKYPTNVRCQALVARLEGSQDQQIATTIVSVEEQWRGWMAVIARFRDVHKQVKAYAELVALLDFFGKWQVQRFDLPAADRFAQLRKAGIRIGTMDLKIAAIALSQDALLLSANLRDFAQVPGLRVENWLD